MVPSWLSIVITDKMANDQRRPDEKLDRLIEQSKTRKHAQFEDILDIIGHFRQYQVAIYILLSLPEFGAAMAMVSFIFTHANPGWRCLR